MIANISVKKKVLNILKKKLKVNFFHFSENIFSVFYSSKNDIRHLIRACLLRNESRMSLHIKPLKTDLYSDSS